ncbi:probable disease resistance protein RF45 [Syzygium oleosum]|uniref:probable disease resistance protein RF45 n=1 Tax=Syzygium oleosum TaxID=219896 RepID=UPI0024B96D5E|nr:probable disease resistance protein RF45 [Syzygium oleosum]
MWDPEVGISPLNAGRSSGASSPSEPLQARMMKDESHIVGREDFVIELVSQLIDKRGDCANLRVISVVGEEAIGKTALVRSVYNRADIKNHFDRCAWVRVGPEPNLVQLMVALLKQLSVVLLKQLGVRELRDVDRLKEEELSNLLQRVLLECCYLVVLDDLCKLHLMDKLIMVLADSRNGSRVIVTTLNRDIPSSIDPWYSTHLELSPLNREQSEKLLKKCCHPFDVVDPPVKLLHLKERIVSKSGGSPAKILLLGGLLSTTSSDRCTELTSLNRCTELVNLLANGLTDCPTLQDVAHLSFAKLPEPFKQCALYLALFPKESEIPTRRLFRLWSAEKNLVSSPSENGVTGFDAEKCFRDLVRRNMVHVVRWKWDGSARTCRLPRTLYDVFYQMAKNEGFLKIYDCSIHYEGKFDAPRIAIHRDISRGAEAEVQVNVPEAGPDNSMPCGTGQLRCYVSFNTVKLGTRAGEIALLLRPLVPKRDSSLLSVLDLEGVYKPLLPEELGEILPNLQYLGLRWTLLEWLPASVAQLLHLETLDLKYTNIKYVPDSILEAEHLRHLYMTEVSLDDAARRHQLQSNKSLNCNIQTIWGLVIKDDSPMLKVLGKLTGLMKLALTCDGKTVSGATKHIKNLEMLKSLRLRLKDRSGVPLIDDVEDQMSEMNGMSGLESLSNLHLLGYLGMQSLLESHIPPNLKVLTLSMSRLEGDPMGVLGKLKCLTALRLFASSYEGKTLSVSAGTFPSLRVLKLWKLENLTEWTIQENAMQCLEDLEIKDCKKLKTIDGLWQIETLEVITLVRVPDELERSVRAMQPNVPIIAKKLPQDEIEEEEQSDEEDGKR